MIPKLSSEIKIQKLTPATPPSASYQSTTPPLPSPLMSPSSSPSPVNLLSLSLADPKDKKKPLNSWKHYSDLRKKLPTSWNNEGRGYGNYR